MKTFFDNLPFGRPNPLHDYIFFKVMGEKGDEIQLLGFLNAVLTRSGKEPIESVEIMENKSFPREVNSGKSCILDLLAVLHDGTKVNIEVQLANKGNIDRRSLYYWSRVYSESLKKGQDYKELPNVVAINIIGFNFPRSGGFHTRFRLREDTDPSLVLTDALEIHCVNMVKWRKLEGKDIHNDPLHRWLAWFDEKSPAELVEEVVSMDDAIMAANNRYLETADSEEAYQIYWSREKARMDRNAELEYATDKGMERGITKGIKLGRVETTTEIAMKMKTAGRPSAEIEQFTGLSPEAIEKL